MADLLTTGAGDPEDVITHCMNPRKVLTSNMTELVWFIRKCQYNVQWNDSIDMHRLSTI